MASNQRRDWVSWQELPPEQQASEVARAAFWDDLQEEQRRSFLESADWPHLRKVEAARRRKLDALVSMRAVSDHLGLTIGRIYELMTTRGLPSWLIDGEWRFDLAAVGRWLAGQGGRAAIGN
jgi:hypothetical protein